MDAFTKKLLTHECRHLLHELVNSLSLRIQQTERRQRLAMEKTRRKWEAVTGCEILAMVAWKYGLSASEMDSWIVKNNKRMCEEK